MPAPDHPSFALLSANARLTQLRAAHRRSVGDSGQSIVRENDEPVNWTTETAVQSHSLPAHLGWGSTVVSTHLRQAEASRQKAQRKTRAQAWGRRNKISHSHSSATLKHKTKIINQTPRPSFIKLYPNIGLGILRQEQAAPGRIWLLLQHSDLSGRGWVYVAEARAILTDKESPLQVCGRRQLRNLLRQGQDIFWQRDKERIWLRSVAKVAHALGVTQLTGRPVGLPVSALLGGIGKVRAHLYTAFHSGRTKETSHGAQAKGAMPIARDTLVGLSGVGRSSQRAYEARVGLAVRTNFAVGEAVTKENQEQRAWKQGQAVFELKDFRGQQGKKGKSYLAWQLPNSYVGQHRKRPRGRQKRINRELKDLVMKGMPGNVEGMIKTQKPVSSEVEKSEKTYFPNGKLAAKAHGRDLERELYWERHRTGNGRFEMWQQLGGR